MVLVLGHSLSLVDLFFNNDFSGMVFIDRDVDNSSSGIS